MAKNTKKSTEVVESKGASSSPSVFDWDKNKKTIQDMYFQGHDVSDSEIDVFRHIVNRTGLDPLARQIYPVFRKQKDKTTGVYKEVLIPLTSIDGYRLIADKTGRHAGTEDAFYQKEKEIEITKTEYVNGQKKYIKKKIAVPGVATVTVYKITDGKKFGYSASARWEEYCPESAKEAFMWHKMPYLMLAKCAEALALRKAFPADFSNIYTDAEMTQSDQVEAPAGPPTVQEAIKKLKEAETVEDLKSIWGDCLGYAYQKPTSTQVSVAFLEHLAELKNLKAVGNLSDESGILLDSENRLAFQLNYRDPAGYVRPMSPTPAVAAGSAEKPNNPSTTAKQAGDNSGTSEVQEGEIIETAEAAADVFATGSITDEQIDQLSKLRSTKKVSDEDFSSLLSEYGATKVSDLNIHNASQLIEYVSHL